MTRRYAEIAGERFLHENGAWMTFSLEHDRVHTGQVFHVGTYGAALANNGTALLTLKTGASQAHIMWNASVGGNSSFRVIENGAVAGSVAATAYNRNRASAGTPLAAAYTGGTLTGGTALTSLFLPGGSGGLRAGSGTRADNEWLGKENWSYTFEVVNLSGQAAGMSIALEWYEESES